jgi:hypothetical protein
MSSLTRFTYLDLIGFVVVELDLIYTLDLIGFVVVVHIELCLLDFIRFFKLYKI